PVLEGNGKLSPAQHEPLPGFNTGPLPRWQVRLGGKVYYLVFDGKKQLEDLAARINRGWVKIRGRVERRTFALGRGPRPDGRPVTKEALLVPLTVLVVDSLDESELEHVQPDRPVHVTVRHVTVRAEVQWHGNRYFRLPNGGIASTKKLYAWESCYIVVDGREVRVEGLPGDILVQQAYHGQTLTLVGRLVQRPDTSRLGPVPPDVLIVGSFRRV
ncbi:MAG: hypothetical protein L0Z62_01245, partial [Gemmataceae bacterium]|nr:hypothetical protein [Gemmataceae bacterium]